MTTIHKAGRLRGEKIEYRDGIGYCVWYIMPGTYEESGLCFDIVGDDIFDLIRLLCELSKAEPDKYSYETFEGGGVA